MLRKLYLGLWKCRCVKFLVIFSVIFNYKLLAKCERVLQMKEIQDKIIRFESLDLQMEEEWKQLEQVKNLLFVDQLSVLFHKSNARKNGDRTEENVKTDVS